MWHWLVKSPDGRVLFREYGGRQSEARAYACAEAFNRHVPRGSKLATVCMYP